MELNDTSGPLEASRFLLTEKHCEVMDLVVRRKTTKEIAQILNISPKTVDQRLDRVRSLLDAPTRRAAVDAYLRHCQDHGRVRPASVDDRALTAPIYDMGSDAYEAWGHAPYPLAPLQGLPERVQTEVVKDASSSIYALQDPSFRPTIGEVSGTDWQTFFHEAFYGRYKILGRLLFASFLTLILAAAAVLVLSFGQTVTQLGS